MPNCVHSVCWHVCVSKHTQDGSVVPDASSSVQLCVYADLIPSPLGPQVAVAAREAHRCDLLIFPSVGLTPRRSKHASDSSLLPSSPSCPPSCRQAYVHTSHLLLLLVA